MALKSIVLHRIETSCQKYTPSSWNSKWSHVLPVHGIQFCHAKLSLTEIFKSTEICQGLLFFCTKGFNNLQNIINSKVEI